MSATNTQHKPENANDDHDDQGNHGGKNKTVTTLVNARPIEWSEDRISFEDLVQIVYANHPLTENDTVTIAFSRGPDDKREGSLTAGSSVKVKDKMVFDVYLTTRS